ncbi:MAG: NTP transferase domain-containing protein [Thermoguttaceae bacterium]|nr:NTP transferase domain-containing protein [Thermoguttaceae bacterium]MBP3695475.1 NTP transferase domain-containing protein [Thermoguttaceae bacterium]
MQAAVILAAGKGTRMRSELPKVLTPVCGRPMIEYPLDALHFAGIDRIFAIVGYRSEDVQAALAHHSEIEFVLQTEQKGTGHAVRMCVPQLRALLEDSPSEAVPVVIVAGDSPMMQGETIAELLAAWHSAPCACILGTIEVEDPRGLGRILRDENGNFCGIVEEKDATESQRKIHEVNQSYYVFDAAELVDVLDALTPNNAQGEYYITDAPAILLSRGKTVRALPLLRPQEAVSVNTPEELEAAERLMMR